MAQFLRTVLQQDVSLAPSTVLDPVDLPVNPLSHILLTVKAANDTGTLSDYSFLGALMSFISNVQVTFKGQALISGTLTDIAFLNGIMTGFTPVQVNVENTNNEVRGATFMISFSRRPFWMMEAFPSVRRGELQFQITSGAAVTGLDTFIIQSETIELLDARPERFLKYTTVSKTPAATGDHDVDLPIGNDILGVLLFGTTTPEGTSFAASIGQIRMLIDNVETGYANTNWETLHGELGRRMRSSYDWQGHFHNLDATGGADSQTNQQEHTEETVRDYAYLDYDPLVDGTFALKTSGRARVHLRITADVADAIRVVPIELLTVGGAIRPAVP